MELPKIPFCKKHRLIFKAIAVGGILGFLYAVIAYVGFGYEYVRLLLGTIIGIAIGFIVITFEKYLTYLDKYSFVVSMILKALIYSISILVLLLFSVVIFSKILEPLSYREALHKYMGDRLLEDFLF